MTNIAPPCHTDRPPRAVSRTTHRTLFLSDLHLGTRMCQAKRLLSFLASHKAETVFLVGDIVDNWRSLARAWPETHVSVLRHILAMPGKGTRVVYVPGNHDAFFRTFAMSTFDGIEVRREAMHRMADGSRFLVTHGDQCDVFSHRLPVLARAGSLAEGALRDLDLLQRRACRATGLREWNGIERLISGTNAFMRRYDRFEDRLCGLARARGLDGIVCGHFHQPALEVRDDVVYANCGDWTENATAIVEGFDGTLRMLWADAAPVPQLSTPAVRDDDGQSLPETA